MSECRRERISSTGSARRRWACTPRSSAAQERQPLWTGWSAGEAILSPFQECGTALQAWVGHVIPLESCCICQFLKVNDDVSSLSVAICPTKACSQLQGVLANGPEHLDPISMPLAEKQASCLGEIQDTPDICNHHIRPV